MNIDMSIIEVSVTSSDFLRRLRPRLMISRVVWSLDCSTGRSSSISLSSSVSSPVSICKKGFTVVDRKLVGLLGNYTL